MKKALTVLTLSTLLLTGACTCLSDCSQEDEAEKSCQHPILSNEETPAHFAFNSSKLDAADKANLDQIANRLMDHPGEKVQIIGYTDNIGSMAYNKVLSQQRAKNAAKYLEWRGIAANRISTKGEGAADFITTNTTSDGRAQNRRIKVSFYR